MAGMRLGLPRNQVRRNWHRVRRWLPVIGDVYHAASLAGLFRVMTILTKAGTPLPVTLRIAGQVNDDLSLLPGIERICEELQHGQTPVLAVRHGELFPREVLPVFRWTEDGPLFIKALDSAATMYAARSQWNAAMMLAILEPVVIIGVGLIVSSMIAALLLPMINLMNSLALGSPWNTPSE